MRLAHFKDLPPEARQLLADAYARQVDPDVLIDVGKVPALQELVIRLSRDMTKDGLTVEEGNEAIHALFNVEAPRNKAGNEHAVGKIVTKVKSSQG